MLNDTTLLLSDSNIYSLYDRVNTEFRKVCDFFRMNKLALHHGKTNFILFTKQKINNPSKLLFNNNNDDETDPFLIHEINSITVHSQTPAAKFLGVYFDPLLNFKFHIDTVRKKLSKALYMLRMAKNVLNPDSLTLLYYSLFHCHLIYALPIWSCTSWSNVKPLFVMQKNAIRIINNMHYNAHTEPLFKINEILPLPDLIDY